MARGVWTEAMDKLLLDRRFGPGRTGLRPWRVVYPVEGMGKKACQDRVKFLLSDEGRPEVKVAAGPKPPEASERDGLKWLREKKRITHQQYQEGLAYRICYRDANAGTVGGYKSSLNFQEGGAGPGASDHQTYAAGSLTATRELFIIRWQVLAGQDDMLTVMDGICGLGHTARFLAGGDQGRTLQLEAVLKVALDLMVQRRSRFEKAA